MEKVRTLKTSLTMEDIVSFHAVPAQTAPSPEAAITLAYHTPDPLRYDSKIYINYLGLFSKQPLDFEDWETATEAALGQTIYSVFLYNPQRSINEV